jgi:23S rRNA (uracil1939-C5)-methyltransferase
MITFFDRFNRMNRRYKKRQGVSLEMHKAEIEAFSHDGRGIARLNGKTTFIQGALPTEKVTFRYVNKKRDFDEGLVVTVEHASLLRVLPRCPHYNVCGGCSLQHLNATSQIEVKQFLLLNSLKRIGHVTPEHLLPPLSHNSWHYRNKARLAVLYSESRHQVLLGFREKNNPRRIADIDQCLVLNSQVNEQLKTLNALINSFDIPAIITDVEVAAGDKDVALIFRTLKPLTKGDQKKLHQFGNETKFLLFLQPKGIDSVILFHANSGFDYLNYSLPDEQITFKFHPTDFIQVNAKLNQEMVSHAIVLMNLKADDVVLDLFCGLGNFSLPLARHCKLVIGVEASHTMVARACMNAQLNKISNATFYCADLEKVDALANIVNKPIDKILIDPPRCGALEIVKNIHKLNPKRLVYVSCNPATLARDSDILVNRHGFRLKVAGVIDMFPHTTHVESIALFEKDS